MRHVLAVLLSLSVAVAAVPCAAGAAEAPDPKAPKKAGAEVPTPKRTKSVLPKYPPAELARGQRALVVVEVIVAEDGRVEDAKVLHGGEAFAEAALEAVRQWRYEVTKVNGRAVRVSLTVPLSFAAKLPEVTRAAGIPELRQGAAPGFPAGQEHGKSVVARLEIDAEGRVAESIVQSGDSPWREVLLETVGTWRFASPDDGKPVVCDLHADFKARGNVVLELRNPRPPAPDAAATDDDAGAAPSASSAVAAPASPEPAAPAAAEPATSAPATASTAAPAASATVPAPPSPPAAAASAPPVAAPPASAATPAPRAAARPTAPPVEVVSGGPPPSVVAVVPTATPPPQENGASAIAGVELAAGIPDLVRGRKPVSPPLARMAGLEGDVRVRFTIDSGGVTAVSETEGPEELKEAAASLVRSWVFRRVAAHRVYALAEVRYRTAGSTAAVRPTE
jgi:TonB family protein